ncbi:MAG: SMC-Scp complex subunit ScpB [Bacilli bacterium]|jgi:segregation and condensation protein B|nr:SMC-Scp complex subunit ScpB [Bacilli bacterium]
MNLLGVLEGVLFVVGDEGVTLDEMSRILEVSKEEVKRLLLILKEEYEKDNRGLRIRYLGNAFKLSTKEEHKVFYQKFLTNAVDYNTLSAAALEVLAIIAYHEPITRVEIDEMRGISSSFTIRKLVAKGLIKEAGKSDLPGRPNLYKITKEFLDYFGLATKEDLPDINSILPPKELDSNPDLFTSIYKEEKGFKEE